MRRARAAIAWAAAIAAAPVVAGPGCNALLGIDPLQYQAPGSDGGPPGDGPAGGGDRPGSDAAPSATLMQACLRYIQSYCEWQSRCAIPPEPAATCVQAYQATCTDGWYELPGSGYTPSALDTCADNAGAISCDPPACPLPPGTRGNGLSCASSVQCASGYCTGSGNACGICGPPPWRKVGETCDAPGQYCDADGACVGGVCIKVAALGESCGADTPCARTAAHLLVCTGGRCATVGEAGQPCDPPELVNGWRCYAGFMCDTGTNLCVATTYVTAKLGESCKQVNGVVVNCVAGTYCPCETSASPDPVCRAYPAAGESCIDTARSCGATQACSSGLSCTSGRCAYPPVAPPPACSP